MVDLLSLEAGWDAAVPTDDQALARRVLAVPEIHLGPGRWVPEPPEGSDVLLGYLIVSGALAQEVVLAGDRSWQLLGPGDVVDPFAAQSVDSGSRHEWSVLAPSVVVALDQRFVAATRRWPQLGVVLHRMLAVQAARASVHTALSQLGRVELRVLAMLWHLVDRWGVATTGGIVVDLRLTHELLGRLVGARRPTVTLALKELGQAGLVTRRDDGRLVLAPDSRRLLSVSVA